MFKLLLFVLLTYSSPCEELKSKTLYSIEDAFECINSINITKEEATAILTDVKQLFNAYVFKDILKNELNSSKYYQFSVDIDQRLNNINTGDQDAYSLYLNLYKIIKDIKDLHLKMGTESTNNHIVYFDNFYMVLPCQFVVENNDEHKIKMVKSNKSYNYGYEVPEEVIKNDGKYVKSINGQNPFNFLRDYFNTLFILKCYHGTFSYGLYQHPFFSLVRYPIGENEIPTFDITFEDNTEITVEYKMYYLEPSSFNEYQRKRL